jgi:iron complex transport system substrate-binding protein
LSHEYVTMKIWSLLPSATEILFALGLEDEITGVTHECDYPPQAATKPRVTISHIDSSRLSREIDDQVTERFRTGQQLYGIDEEQLRAAPPDLIVTQDLCPVCAVSPSDFAGHMESAGCSAEIVTLNPKRLVDVLEDVHRVGQATDQIEEADRLRASLFKRVEAVRNAVGTDGGRSRVVCIEWLDPPMPAGHWVPDMLAWAGGGDAGLISAGQPARKVRWAEIGAVDPDVIVLMPCGFGAERAGIEALNLWETDEWRRLTAVQKGRVYPVDANAYFSRPGPRLADGVEILAHLLHPELFSKMPPIGSVLKLVSPPAGASSIENWAPRFEPLIGVPS